MPTATRRNIALMLRAINVNETGSAKLGTYDTLASLACAVLGC